MFKAYYLLGLSLLILSRLDESLTDEVRRNKLLFTDLMSTLLNLWHTTLGET